jgi:two-component system, sensor histidine kinase and response regulator
MEKNFQVRFDSGYILVAEDSMVQAKRIKRFFDENEIEAVICQNGAEAFEKAINNKPLLIISDIMMPVMDGYEFCRKAKEHPDLFDVPFILLTSLSDPLDIIKGLQAGADNFITKPYDDDYLMSRINYLIANQHIRRMGSGEMSIDIIFQDQKFQINSDKKQILDLLLSVYEAAINRNEHLIKAQRQLEVLNENLKAANKELEAFSRTVSHDLCSPLNGVIGFAELIKCDYADVLDEEALSYLDIIIKSGRNMAQLINDLLSFSQASLSKIDAQEINLSELSAKVVKEHCELTYKDARYKATIEDGIMIKADPTLIKVVMNNLIGNALKYSQKSEEPKITIGTREMKGREVIFVRDNGVGFDMQKADSLFRPFIRLHNSNEFQGTGVGLSTVKRIIEKHGGSIWFESEVGKGATFYFAI